jgi:alpha-tubulin suppressor-like RCC1 family protein
MKEECLLVPTRLSSDTNWVDVGLGDFMGFAIKSDGTLWAWGADADIFTGAPDPALNASPRQVGTNHDWRTVAPFANSCVLLMKEDRSLWALDDVLDQRGKRLGDPAWKMQPVPPRCIHLPQDIVAFAGGRHRLGVALTREGEAWTWGWAFGRHDTGTAVVLSLSRFLARAGIPNRLVPSHPEPVIRPEPWQLPNQP